MQFTPLAYSVLVKRSVTVLHLYFLNVTYYSDLACTLLLGAYLPNGNTQS
jgi:hypothetical protein